MTLAVILAVLLPAGAQDAPPTAPEGFKVAEIYAVPKDQGSWVAMTFDPKGRLIVSPQQGKPFRVTLGGEPRVERLDVPVGDAQGLLCAFDSLYVNGKGPDGVGLYRLRDTNGDDQYDDARLLKKWPGGMGEHGPHAVVKGPDDRIYVMIGNHVKVPEGISEKSPHRNYQEDLITPRIWDPNGHAVGILAPGGYVVRTDADGREWELFCGGFRNAYDLAFNPDGELFTFDSDMEWDVGTPWYRPTRIFHCVSGGEYGWRSATGKWPPYYADGLPPAVDVGLSSPTGVAFGTGAKFPPKYRRSLYACDWAYGRILAVHLTPKGATYTGTFELFVTGKPLNVADLEIGPDGAMYFVCGGRDQPSRLYRVSYAGPERPDAAPAEDRAAAPARELRRRLESFQARASRELVGQISPHLNSEDPWIRYAARIALERQEVRFWKSEALVQILEDSFMMHTLALARVGGRDAYRELLDTLNRYPWDPLGDDHKLQLMRIYQVAFSRNGPPEPRMLPYLIHRFDSVLPTGNESHNRELFQLCVWLKAPTAPAKGLDLIAGAKTQEDQLHYAFVLRNVKEGWKIEQRKAFFQWLNKAAREYKGGNSFQGFIRHIRTEAAATLTEKERKELDPILSQSYLPPRPEKMPVVKAWKMEDLLPDLEMAPAGRNFQRGKAAFLKAQCLACHRFGEEGGGSGPDLTAVASRFGRREVLEATVLPSKTVPDLYQNTIYKRKSGDVVVGRLVREDDRKLYVRADPLQDAVIEIARADVEAAKASTVSPMPEGLLNVLSKEEILDLMAYIESAGNAKHPAFGKK